MKYCQECGTELPAHAGFCPQCGYRIDRGPTEEIASQAVQTEQGPSPQAPWPQAAAMPPPAAPAPPVYAQQAPPPQAPYPPAAYPPQYAYGAPPVAPRRKKRWYIPVIIVAVILGLLAGSWFVFGDQIRNLFSSPEKRWARAEEEIRLIPGDSFLAPVREAAGDLMDRQAFGSVTDLTFDIKADDLPGELAEVLTVLSGLRLQLATKVDMQSDETLFHTRLGLGKRGESEEALAVELYNVDDYYIISLPGILDRPLAVSGAGMEDLTGSSDFQDIMVNPGDLLGMTGARDQLDFLVGDDLDKLAADLREIFNKYAGAPEVVKDELVTFGGVSQKLDYFELVVPADQFAPMAKEILTYLRDSKDLENLLTQMSQPALVPGADMGGSDLYHQFLESIEEAIDDVERDPDQHKIEARRRLYVDKKNKPVGEEMTFTGDIDEGQQVTFASLQITDGSRHAQRYAIESADDFSLEFLTTYTMDRDRRTGDFSVKLDEGGFGGSSKDELLSGSYSDFAMEKAGDDFYPVGKISIKFLDQDGSMTGSSDMVVLNYDGKIESGQLIASLEIRLTMDDEPLSITLGVKHKPLTGPELVFKNEMPELYVDVEDDEAMMELMEDDSVMSGFMDALEKLGLDPDLFEGSSDDWDDWDDDWDDWDWD